ncbi:helix-turn-helix domain-containing protein [Embleya sp. NPDC059237]|uniref:helix-turn-helix domain-containing protein n=1 Tax=Embleya sp. NPDC059237 TaxID=3346784 RepID=UPI00369388FA
MHEHEPVGALIARVRRQQGKTQQRLADLLCAASGDATVTRHEVSRWERGTRLPTRWLPWISTVLGISREELEVAAAPLRGRRGHLGSTTPSSAAPWCTEQWTRADAEAVAHAFTADHVDGLAARVAHEWLLADAPQVYEMRSGRRVGAALADTIRLRGDRLRRMDDVVGGTDLYPVIATELADTLRVLREGAYTDETGRALLTVGAELAQLAGWVASDLGMHAQAERDYLAGVRLAHGAGDRPLAANLLSTLSYQMANTGREAEAVLVARSAEAGGRREATADVRALLLERVAWAHARADQPRECDRALGAADDAFERGRPGDEEPEWVYWLNRNEMDVMAGRCYTELRRPLRAEPLLRGAVDRYDARHTREVSLYLSWLAEAYLQAREVDEAAGIAMRVLDIAAGIDSARSHARLSLLADRLARHESVPSVREFRDRFAEVVP